LKHKSPILRVASIDAYLARQLFLITITSILSGLCDGALVSGLASLVAAISSFSHSSINEHPFFLKFNISPHELLVYLVLLALIRLVLSYFLSYMVHNSVFKLSTRYFRAANDLFSYCLDVLSPSETSVLFIAKANDIIYGLLANLSSIIVVFSTAIFIFLFLFESIPSFSANLYFLPFAFALFLVSIHFKFLKPLSKSVQDLRNKFSSSLQDFLCNISEYMSSPPLLHSSANILTHFAELNSKQTILYGSSTSIRPLLDLILVITILFFIDTLSTSSSLVIYVILGLRILPMLSSLFSSLSGIASGFEALQEFRMQFSKTKLKIYDYQNMPNLEHDFCNISISSAGFNVFVPSGKQISYPPFDFAIKPSIIMVEGPSGSGKTLFLKSISGIFRLGSGTIRLPNPLPLFLPQSNSTYSISCRQFFASANISCDLPFVKYLISYLFSDQFLRTIRFDDPSYMSGLSGGQLKRFFIIRALAQNPRVLILDEPTSPLDLQSSLKLFEVFSSLDILVIMTTHRYSDLNHCTQSYRVA